MSFVLPELPYAKDAFNGILSVEAFDYHHGKHHAAYVNNLNNLNKQLLCLYIRETGEYPPVTH